jgi:hypothetical protein
MRSKCAGEMHARSRMLLTACWCTGACTAVQLSMDKLKTFVEDEDQNLKYLGLVAMGNFMKVHPKVVSEHKIMILKCLEDEDITIKHRSSSCLNVMCTSLDVAAACL